MSYIKFVLTLCLLVGTNAIAEDKEINYLLEKVSQTSSSKEKQELLEELKHKLAIENKKTQAEADAIIKAKKKIPSSSYNDPK